LDLFVSRRQPDGSWSQAENLGFPINSSGDENSLQVFPDGRTALFATDREVPGNLDLWQFELPGFAAAASVALWRGEVLDADSQRPIRASVHVLDHLGNVVGTQSSSEVDGAFTLTFPATERVILQVEGYGFYSKAFEPTVGQEPFVSIELQRLEVGTVLVLRDVRFERSSAALDPSFQPDLEQLARTMQNAEFRIRIAGHTDGQGSAQRNQTLSEERALSVVRFLEAFGIDGSRMETIGYGMSQPIATNETEEGRALNRRTEIEIIQ
jgi:outer membrane protein OmpA-like peptidoglycan-associated protein